MTSFKRRIPPGAQCPESPVVAKGTRVVARTGQTCISTGVSAFNDVVGGGFPLGSLVLVKQDRGSSYANLLLRYFAAQGLVDGQEIVVVSDEGAVGKFLRSLPRPIDGQAAMVDKDEDEDQTTISRAETLPGEQRDDGETANLKIAWRYKPSTTFSSDVKADSSGAQRKTGSTLAPQPHYISIISDK